MRRDSSSIVLVVANLGTTPLTGAHVFAQPFVGPAEFQVRDLLTGEVVGRHWVAGDVIPSAFTPIQALAPMRTYVLGIEFLRRPARRVADPRSRIR